MNVLNGPTHHGKTKIFSYIFWHIDQPPLGSCYQNEAVQGLKKGLVWQWAVWSLLSWESLERKSEFSFCYTCVHLSRLSQRFDLIPVVLQTYSSFVWQWCWLNVNYVFKDIKEQTVTGVWRLTLEENRLPDVGADGGHGVQVGESLLVLLGDGQQGAHIPDLMIDVVPPGFRRSFGRSVRDHGHWCQCLEENWLN